MTGGDLLVALPRATRNGETLFGHNCNRADGEGVELLRQPGRDFSPGEWVRLGELMLPQPKRTWTVLAGRCPGQWGYIHGVNEHGVSMGLTAIGTKRRDDGGALTGPDLLRLSLERAASARQAVDVLTALLSRHGQANEEADCNPAFLIADGGEAFAIETFGRHWAAQHVSEVRAVGDVCHLRQDWDRVSPGLASAAIERGWWPADGSKLDFAAAIGREGGDNAAALRRWGRATLLLEQHNGQMDLTVARRILRDHFADNTDPRGGLSLCRHKAGRGGLRTAASLIVQVGSESELPIAWFCFGSPCRGVYFPFFLIGELPQEWRTLPAVLRDPPIPPEQDSEWRTALADLQERFDRQTREFIAEAKELRQRGEMAHLPRLAELFALHNLEAWENLCPEFAPMTEIGGRVHTV